MRNRAEEAEEIERVEHLRAWCPWASIERFEISSCVRKVVNSSGQASVELVVVFPVAIILAVILVNSLLFFSDCAAFDRVARNAARTYMTAPAYGEDAEASLAYIQRALDSSFDRDNVSCTAHVSKEGPFLRVKAELAFTPTLFGMGLKENVFGVQLPPLKHEVSLCVYRYKPGVIF